MSVGNKRGRLRKTSHGTHISAILSPNNDPVALFWARGIPTAVETNQTVKDAKYSSLAMTVLEKYLTEKSDIDRGLAEWVLVAFNTDRERNTLYFAGKPPLARKIPIPILKGGMQPFILAIAGEDISTTFSPTLGLSSVAPDWGKIRIGIIGKPRRLSKKERDRVLDSLQRARAFEQTQSENN